MNKNQTRNGKAFEYACLASLYDFLSLQETVTIISSAQLATAKAFFNSLSSIEQLNLRKAADAAVRILVRLEPQLREESENKPLLMTIQTDAEGMGGDVRDILCLRRQNNWEIGLSCKHNHHAVKHSRLSANIDFGSEWVGCPCRKNYFEAVFPIFEELSEIRRRAKMTGNRIKWSDLPGNKAERYYRPLLEAFKRELLYICANNLEAPKRLIQYLLGRYDFYKVISDEGHQTTRVEAVNINGTLNRPSANHRSIADVGRLRLPTRIYHLDFKPESNNTLLLACDNGWEISMRIHNASSFVEPSLKFDVQLISLPSSIYAQVEPWDSM